MKRQRLLMSVLAAVVLVVPQFVLAAAVVPEKKTGFVPYARADKEFASAIVVDVTSGKVLYEYQADKSWPAASLTKLMGALVFLDHRPSWTKVVSITKADEVGGGRLRVAAGATLTALDLIYSSITASANNAATAMARVSGLGYAGFVKSMNAKAKELKLTQTTFVDPSGIDPKNVTTARDMSRLAMTAFNQEKIRQPATTGRYRFTIRNTGEVKEIKTTNDLLIGKDYEQLYVTGGKTGFLYESEYNLAVRLKPMGAKGGDRLLMVVVFGSASRDASFKSASALANWAWKGYTWSP